MPSSAARAMWPAVVPRVRPVIVPRAYWAQSIAQPLHYRPANEHAAFQGVIGSPVGFPRHCREQLMPGRGRRLPDVHQHEAAGPVSVLGPPPIEAILSKQRCLLVSRDAADADVPVKEAPGGFA